MSEECLFCKIASGIIPSKIVYESESCMAFLDIAPITTGHTVIIPKKHYETFLDMPANEIGIFFQELQKIAKILHDKLNFDGFNILQNNSPAAGQVIPHFHYHIVPRLTGDNAIAIKQKKNKPTDDELNSVQKKIVN